MNFKQPKILIILHFIIFIFTLSACSVTKKLGQNQYYLKSNKYHFEGKKAFKADLESYVKQKPNTKVLGILPFQDWMYNLVPKRFEPVFEEYYSYPKKERGQKLLDSLYLKYGMQELVGKKHFLYRQFFQWGSEPVVLDTALSYASAKNLEEMYFNRGYFDAEVSPIFSVDTTAKKASVTYKINIKEPSYISSFNQSINNRDIEKIYGKSIDDSEIKINQRFDVRNFEKERDRIARILKNNGYYKFNELGDELVFRVDSTNNKELGVTMRIAKPKTDTLKQFIKYHFGNIEIYPNNTENNLVNDIFHDNYRIKSNNHFKIHPRVFTDAITIKKGEIYSDKAIDDTRTLIFDRENFTLTSILAQAQPKDSTVDVKIFLQPKPKYDLQLSFETMYSQLLNFGISPGLRLLNRNIFRGGENLEFNLRGTVGTVNKSGADKQFFNAYEISFNTELTFPRWILPFNTEGLMPKSYNLKSSLGLGLSGQKSIGLGNRNYLAYLNYKFQPGASEISLEPLNFQYIRNTEKSKYYKIFTLDNEIKNNTFKRYFQYSSDVETLYTNQEISESNLEQLISQDEEFVKTIEKDNAYNFKDYTDFRNMIFRKSSITQDVFIQPIAISMHYNESKKFNKPHPWNIYARASVSGLLLRAADAIFKFKKQQNLAGEESSVIGGVPYSEYVRLDLDVRKTFNFGNKHALALRSFFGIAIPYGNSFSIPFSRAYFGGGSNDVRAWKAYELSPSPLRPNDTGTYIDNMKITWNAEYRFPISGIFNGAAFLDAGNIWNISKDEGRNTFKFSDFYKQLGIGAGLGARFDLTFVVVRLDFAYKIHDPAYEEGHRWIRDFNLLKPQLQFGINYPF